MKRIVVAALTVAATLAGLTCGGTTGREGLPATGGNDATLTDAGAEANTVDDSASAGFDVDILYADRTLPDVAAPSEGGLASEAGYPWPDCPPFVGVSRQGKPVPAGMDINQIPAAYDDAGQVLLDDAGRVVTAPDGSACASYGWLGSTEVDTCLTANNSGSANLPVLLPPCNWCFDAGTAVQGPRAGAPKYDVCLELYRCIRRTGCGLSADKFSIAACLCGDASPSTCMAAQGPCGTEELAALEHASDPMSVHDALLHYTDISPSPSFCGGALNQVFQDAITGAAGSPCFPADAGPF